MTETIVAAAIRIEIPQRYRDLGYPNFLSVSALPPARHHSLLHPVFTPIGHGVGPEDQGFLTSTGRYVGREEALEITLASGQPTRRTLTDAVRLFSEDLW